MDLGPRNCDDPCPSLLRPPLLRRREMPFTSLIRNDKAWWGRRRPWRLYIGTQTICETRGKLIPFALLLSVVLPLMAPTDAQAYIDPGSGSVLLQSILAAVAAGFVTVRLFFKRISTKFGRTSSKPEERPTTDDNEIGPSDASRG